MENQEIKINDYMYFDTEYGYFRLTNEALEIIYRKKGIICSYSGANEWIHHFTCEMIDLYSGSSKYNYSLGTTVHETELPKIFIANKDAVISWVEKSLEKEWGQHLYTMIKNIIDDVPACD